MPFAQRARHGRYGRRQDHPDHHRFRKGHRPGPRASASAAIGSFVREYAAVRRALPTRPRPHSANAKPTCSEIYIATSAKQEMLDVLLDIAGCADLLSDVASKKKGDDSKPDPDIVEKRCARAGSMPTSSS